MTKDQNPTAWNLRGKIGFLWAPICALCWLWAYYRLPEMKGRSYYEIDVMFERKIPARRFKNYVVEEDADERMRQEQGIVRS
jgi:SP family general alpha glucoside:H+ symporter-like MFS transporter